MWHHQKNIKKVVLCLPQNIRIYLMTISKNLSVVGPRSFVNLQNGCRI